MAIINRIYRLFRSDFNAVLDRIEEPELLLKQAIREMQDDIQEDRQGLKALELDNSECDRKLAAIQQELVSVEDELDICFENNEIELARDRVKRKLGIKYQEKIILDKKQSLITSKESLAKRINENDEKLQSMLQKLELLGNNVKDDKSNDINLNMDPPVSDNEIEIALLKEQQARRVS